MTIRISGEDARRAFLGLQGLGASPRRALTVAGLDALIGQLGFVQLDSIQTVARAHHMILRARADGYRPALLQRLHERERRLFEHWTHDASVIPVAHYPHWRRRMERDAEWTHTKFSEWHGADFKRQVDAVLDRITQDGPAMARDFTEPRKRSEAGWWNWHEGKIALEYLWRTGRLAIAGRHNFQKVYDLVERVVPEPYVSETTDHDAYIDWACSSALDRLGFATAGDLARFWDLVTIDEAKAWAARATDDGRAHPICIEPAEGSPPRDMIARADLDRVLQDTSDPPDRIRALSPFDPVLRDRKRLAWLFGFDYRIEVFVPAPKRKYGYYVFPLLERDRLIGRIDMTADRDRDALVVTALWLEPGIRLGGGRTARLEGELDRLRRFVGLGQVVMQNGFHRDHP